jgi:hypothetical protein
MAQTKCNSASTDVTRRTLLRTSAVAIGAALLPVAAGAAVTPATTVTWADARGAAQGLLREGYRREVARIAEVLRPDFASGAFRGWRDEDHAQKDQVLAKKAGIVFDPDYRSPFERLEEEVGRQLGFGDEGSSVDEEELARFILLSTSSEEADSGSFVMDAIDVAAQDVLRYARERHWYIGAGEEARS